VLKWQKRNCLTKCVSLPGQESTQGLILRQPGSGKGLIRVWKQKVFPKCPYLVSENLFIFPSLVEITKLCDILGSSGLKLGPLSNTNTKFGESVSSGLGTDTG
jgi:hypothetical protein